VKGVEVGIGAKEKFRSIPSDAQDGAPDFFVVFAGRPLQDQQNQPLIWLNDGTGHFSTLKVGDFVAAGREPQIGSPHLVRTRNGYSFITALSYEGSGGLRVKGLLATKPYRITPTSSAPHD
jgi:hypothetical protein